MSKVYSIKHFLIVLPTYICDSPELHPNHHIINYRMFCISVSAARTVIWCLREISRTVTAIRRMPINGQLRVWSLAATVTPPLVSSATQLTARRSLTGSRWSQEPCSTQPSSSHPPTKRFCSLNWVELRYTVYRLGLVLLFLLDQSML